MFKPPPKEVAYLFPTINNFHYQQKIKQTDLVKLNKLLVKAGKEEIKVISKKEYFKED